jgi:hypothetical protein
MIELIEGLPDNVIGLNATGTITGDDYENVVVPAIEEHLERHDKVRLLYHCGPEMTGFVLTAAWDDAKVGLKHMTRWERIAVVTDEGWIANSVKVFGFMMPGHIKVFANDELAAARDWISS